MGSKFGRQESLRGGVQDIIRNSTRKSTFKSIITRSRKVGSIIQRDMSPDKIHGFAQTQQESSPENDFQKDKTASTMYQSTEKNSNSTPQRSISGSFEHVPTKYTTAKLPQVSSPLKMSQNKNLENLTLLKLQEVWKDFEVIPE